MLPNIPLTLKLQNGAVTYFVLLPTDSNFKDLAMKLTNMINISGGFTKDVKAIPIDQMQLDIPIPKTSFDDDSSDEEIEDAVANTTQSTIMELEGAQLDLDSLKFAIPKNGDLIDLDNLTLIDSLDSSLQEYKVSDYGTILFAMKEDEFNLEKPILDRDGE